MIPHIWSWESKALALIAMRDVWVRTRNITWCLVRQHVTMCIRVRQQLRITCWCNGGLSLSQPRVCYCILQKVMATLTLHAEKNDWRVLKIRVVASYVGLDVSIVQPSSAEEWTSKHPMGSLPALETHQGVVFHSNSIISYCTFTSQSSRSNLKKTVS